MIDNLSSEDFSRHVLCADNSYFPVYNPEMLLLFYTIFVSLYFIKSPKWRWFFPKTKKITCTNLENEEPKYLLAVYSRVNKEKDGSPKGFDQIHLCTLSIPSIYFAIMNIYIK